MNKPTFSILTPVYNTDKFLHKSIASILQQSFTDWELILVNDGSTDSSGKICDEYKNKYPDKIKVFHNRNFGQLYSRNFAISKARGKYYLFVDSDDELQQNSLEIIYDKFSQYQCDCLIYGMVKTTREHNKNQTTITKEFVCNDKRFLYRKIFLNNAYNSLCIKAIKSNLIVVKDYAQFYHIRHAEDLIQSLDILHNCNKVVFIPNELYIYNQNLSSVTRTINKQPLNISFEVREKVLEFLKQEKIFTKEDMEDYHRYCVKIFEGQIKQACRHPSHYKEKIKLFKNVRRQSYYKNFLASNKYIQSISFIYTQFHYKLYWLLVLESKIYQFILKVIK